MSDLDDKIKLIWDLAEYLRHDYQQRENADVILPLVVLRRLDQFMTPKRKAVREAYKKYTGKLENLDAVLKGAAGGSLIYNHSEFDWDSLLNTPQDLAQNLIQYFNSYSPDVQDIIEKFDFRRQISRLQAANLLFPIFKLFETVDLHPSKIEPHDMGYIFEELIRKFSEQDNQTAGEHFSPREAIELMADLLLSENIEDFLGKTKIIEFFDPACGTGGMLTEGKKRVIKYGQKPENVYLFGQEINPISYAIAKADLLLKGEDPHLLVFGNSFSEDGHTGKKFRLMLTNPPFGVEWKKVEYIIRNEYEAQGFDGRFGAGLPRITDGSFLFLQHMLAKRFEDEVGSRIAIIFNGSPLFSGDAGSGESEIRRWIIENDWLEGIIALPDQMFYNTGINTYIWIVTNRKSNRRKGKVQLINATEEKVFWELMPKNLGSKRHRINIEQRARIISLYKDMQPNEYCKIFNNIDFGYRRIRVDRPLRLNFSASPERLENVSEQPAFKALTESKKTNINEQVTDCKAGEALQRDILNALKTLPSDLQKDSRKFLPLFEKTLKTLKLKDPLVKSILQALTERDEDAFPMPGKKTEFEPDSELRDYESIPLNYASSIYDENVPLKENVHSFFEREVLPYAKDAWIDEAYRDEHDSNVGVVGYEVNANRYFYKYISPSTPSEFDKRIAELANDIENLVKTRVGHAVTKGIKLNTKMKPSGVEWLGDVPAHWETRRLKFLVRIINGATPSSAEEKYWDGDIAWVTPEDLGRLKTITISETKRKITQEGYQSCGTTLAPSGSVVISTRAPIGYLAIAEMAICTNQGCRTLVVNKNLITSHYLYFSLLASRHILAVYGEGSTFKELGKSELANFTIALPPIEEQEEISRFLLSEINNIDIMVAKIEENIQLLLKQRSSIVSAAVTGKN